MGIALKNHVLGQLVKDVRNMMQPHTAISLKERRANRIKDFISVSGQLGISYMMLFSQNEESGGIHLRLARMPHGPTISFKVVEYSLCKDVARSQKTPKSLSKGSVEFQSPPLLVLNGFTNPKEAESYEKLVITMFQNMFPAINPQVIKVGTIRRVMLINKDKKTGLIDIRHYVIDTKPVDVSKNVRRLVTIKKRHNKRIPNLSKVTDVADIILDPYAAAGFTSESEVETDAVVEVPEEEEQNVTKMKHRSKEKEAKKEEVPVESSAVNRKKAVKLTEIGPRLKLKLEKIEEGVCDGKVMYHWRIHKTDKEVAQMDSLHARRKKDKEDRKKQQKENVERKMKKKRKKVVSFKEPEAKRQEKEKEEKDEKKEKKESNNDFIGVDDDSDQLFDEE